MLLPGPEAQQLATYIGWRLFGPFGGVLAGGLFVLPSALLLWVLSILYVSGGDTAVTAALFAGIQPVVVALIALAAWRIARRSLTTRTGVILALGSFLFLTLWKVPFPLVLLACGAVGLFRPDWLDVRTSDNSGPEEKAPDSLRAGWTALILWLVPVALLVVFERGLLAELAVFFSTTSVLTFGGAYAILPYVAQVSVEQQWMTPAQMVDGVGLAEATPGPLIIVLQFVGFLAPYQNPGAMAPIVAGTLGALIATWTTFVPSFVWIFFAAPHVERLRRNLRLSGGLAAISACVAGIVASLAVWFGAHVFFPSGPVPDLFAIALFVAVFPAQRLGVLPLIALGALAGLARQVFFS